MLFYLCFDIFSSFDSSNGVFMGFSWFLWFNSFMFIFLISLKYWCGFSYKSVSFLLMFRVVFSLITRSFSKYLSGFSLMGSSMFFMIFLFNFLGLVPYVFSVTSHLMITLCFSLPLWFSLIFSGLLEDSKGVLSHLVIYGSPDVLMMFLVVVESVSICIRPITLSVRLIANMSAGHVVLTLICSFLSVSFFCSSKFILIMVFFVSVFYFIFEVGVSLIQSYVFCLLWVLYSDDHPN